MSYSLKSIFASLPRTTRGQPIVIGGDPKGKNFLYTNGNSVIIRDIENPAIADVYTEHSVQVNVAQYSPSGFYIASGDVSGKVRIWDTTQKEHILKYEYHSLGGQVKDISWSPDNQRLVVAGDGNEKFAHVFLVDTGTSVGEVIGHSKGINSVDYKKTRPFRIVTGSEDLSAAFYEGPPFKFKFSLKDHSRFVNVVRYSPNGELFVTGGAEGKVFIYDGKTGEKKGELGGGGSKGAHAGGIYGLSWSGDSTQLLTVSGDKMAKLWDMGTSSAITEFVMGTEIEDQQVGCLWQGDHLLTVSLSGCINYLDKNNPSSPSKILKGHNKSITAVTLNEDKSEIYSGSHDGLINSWGVSSGMSTNIKGKGHSNQVSSMDLNHSINSMVSIGMDDTVRATNCSKKEYTGFNLGLSSQPKGVACSDDFTVVACLNEVVMLRGGNQVSSLAESYEPSCVSIHPNGTEVAVGGSQDSKVHIYSVNGEMLLEINQLVCSGSVTDVGYSPDGAYLAASDGARRVSLWRTEGYLPVKTEWVYHSAKVNRLAWTPDSRHVASGGLDTNAMVWSIETPNKRIAIKGAHPQNQVTAIQWLDNNRLLTAGQDCCLRQWDVIHVDN